MFMKKNNISKFEYCFGCGVCAVACPKKIIQIKTNSIGFYVPYIENENLCIECGICKEVCSFAHNDIALKQDFVKPYAGWSKSPGVRRVCSSGGIGFEIGRSLISKGFKVCAVRYNVDLNRAEHYVANSPEELLDSIGSKYIQSYTLSGFADINRKDKYLVVGTPCQIDSFRRYIKKFRCEDRFILMDFFCHGVPSSLMWQKYLKSVEKVTGQVDYVSWRNKFTGWHDSWSMAVNGAKTQLNEVPWYDSYNLLIREKKSLYNSRYSQGDAFYKLFLGDLCLGKQCYKNCRFKLDMSSADIRLGDCWGSYYNDNDEGVSGAIAFTQVGETTLQDSNCILESHQLSVVTEGQMSHNPRRPLLAYVVMFCLEKDIATMNTIKILASIQMIKNKFKRRILHPKRTIKKLFKIN